MPPRSPGRPSSKARGGALIPVGNFSHEQDIGGAYSIAAGYEFLPFLDGLFEFTQAFNPSDDDHEQLSGRRPALRVRRDPSEFHRRPRPAHQLPALELSRPALRDREGRLVSLRQLQQRRGERRRQDQRTRTRMPPASRPGSASPATVFTLYERENDEIPLLEITLGVHGSYHHAFLGGRDDREFVTTMGSLGFRF